MKKVLLTILLALFATFAGMADDFFNYEYLGQTLAYIVTDEDAKTCAVDWNQDLQGEVTIPSTAMKSNVRYTVTAIGEYAFSANTELTSIIIPSSVTKICIEAFASCISLCSVMLYVL